MTAKKFNVLIFPAGSEIGLEIYNSLKYNLHVEIFGASGKPDHARYIYDEEHYRESNLYITAPDFIDRFNDMLTELKIDFVFPTHDSIVLFLAQHQDKLKARILTSPYETTVIAREKRLTYAHFKDFDFCPVTYESPFTGIGYPVFLKPNIGQGAKGTYLVNDEKDLLEKLKPDDDLLVCEYLPGKELSVDCFTNRAGELLFVGPRVRERIQIGISFNTIAVPLSEEVKAIAEKLNQKVKFRGAWFFQIKEDRNGKMKLMEFAARQASTMALYRQLGVNFALLSIFDALDKEVKIIKNNFHVELDRCLYNRYKTDIDYDCVYIDFDDTIIVDDKVNHTAMRFLYQCKNEKVRICLLTKHRYDLNETLKKYCIAPNLFDEIILIDMEHEKDKYISAEKSIFIDNYFLDRDIVSVKKGIPVFDVDAIECLLK